MNKKEYIPCICSKCKKNNWILYKNFFTHKMKIICNKCNKED